LDRLLKLTEAGATTKLRMRALFAAGVLAGEQGDYASAAALINESQDIAQALGDKTGVAVSLNALAVFARDRGDLEVAHILFEASLGLWRELGDQKAIARALSNLANVVKLQGEYGRAHELYVECLSIFRALGDRTGVAWSLNYQGMSHTIRVTPPLRGHCTNRAWQCFGKSMTVGELLARSPIWVT